MATQIRVWEIDGGRLTTRNETDFAAFHREDELEDWIVETPDILGEKLLIIGRQIPVSDGSRLDLLGIDAGGKLVIVELKRSMAPREAVAQALDYASWLNNSSEQEIFAYAAQYLQAHSGESDYSLGDAFEGAFGVELPEVICQNHRILLVAAGLDSSAERIVNYLAQRHSVDINVVFFNFCQLSDHKEILVRSVLVPESATPSKPGNRSNFTLGKLLAMAEENKTSELVKICREVGSEGVWQERCEDTAQGSFRYWTYGKMVYGVNASGRLADAPTGTLDIWLRTGKLAELTGRPEQEIKDTFSKIAIPFSAGKMDFVIRLKTVKDAEAVVRQLKRLADEQIRLAVESHHDASEKPV